ncbi:myTH4 domain protein [Dictyocaulus viviparus]|uniref:MyTH4 domain protein n=1 Tax=Dictyocaulus viviparus TaxID=29172 RepID=A0A0D8Y312_DICVI|nr:myTH4 domain protein [Dictyocaulus viviparus]
MDAISLCEQYAAEHGMQQKNGNAPWRLFFRKEIFSPWHDAREDPIGTDLIYQQVLHGIKSGEYKCDKEEELASLIAQLYYVEEGPLEVNHLENQIYKYLPIFELKKNKLANEYWTGSIMYQYRRQFGVNPPDVHHVKESVVSFAKCRWPLLFSRLGKPSRNTCTIQTVSGDEYYIKSFNSQKIEYLILAFLNGLKQRSRFVIARKNQCGDDSNDLLDFEVGDLLELINGVCGKELLTETLVRGENTKTCLQGFIQSENVYVLPALIKPNANVMIYADNRNDFNRSQEATAYPQWRFGRDVLDMPLLKKLEGRKEQCNDAMTMFMFIMKYMGDHPSRRNRLSTDITDVIFKPAIAHEILRDELYCQLLRQITMNPSVTSEEKGWELIWLATGLLAPSPYLLKEVVQFLNSHQHPIAFDCLNRLKKLNKGCSRKFPPHFVEIEAIQNRTMQILHRVYFPDETNEAIEVESSTKARDLVCQIAKRLRLRNKDGFSLFVKVREKVLAIPETEYFFDFIRNLSDWAQNINVENSMLQINYQVFFMRKLWIDVKPGDDTNADLIFHYYQYLPALKPISRRTFGEEAENGNLPSHIKNLHMIRKPLTKYFQCEIAK